MSEQTKSPYTEAGMSSSTELLHYHPADVVGDEYPCLNPDCPEIDCTDYKPMIAQQHGDAFIAWARRQPTYESLLKDGMARGNTSWYKVDGSHAGPYSLNK